MKLKNDKIIILILSLVLLASLMTGGFGVPKLIQKLSTQRVAQRTIDFVNNNLLPEGMKASLISASTASNGLYSIKFKVADREYDSYISADGKLLFPESISLDASNTKTVSSLEDIPKAKKAEAKLFVMSFCPYGNQAEDLMKPVVELLGDKANIEVRYIVSKDGDNYTSLHGEAELNQDVREVCVAKYQPDKYWNFILGINKKSTVEDVEKKWESIAKDVGVDIQKTKDCFSKEKNTLLAAEVKASEQYGVTGSPTLVVNGVIYQGDRTTNAYKEAICAGFKNAPEECKIKLSNEKETDSGSGCK